MRLWNSRACTPGERASLRCLAAPAVTFFIIEACGPQRAVGHVTTPVPPSTGRRSPEMQDTCQRRSSPQQGGGVQSHGTRGNTGVLHSRETESGATRHVTTPEPSPAPEPLLYCACSNLRPQPMIGLYLDQGTWKSDLFLLPVVFFWIS
jgi:hypothetical protein